MPLNIDQDLIQRAPGGIAPGGGMGMGGGAPSGADIAGLLQGLLGQRGIAPGGAPNGAIAPTGEALTGPPVMGAGQREGGLLSGLGNMLDRFGRRG